ncbi:MAG: ABC transporter substrate-binding protein [Deltaproteobacteria bacterium]|nr:ABC transporter substrate-binding protein [Deltaproteobacteria bacterium]
MSILFLLQLLGTCLALILTFGQGFSAEPQKLDRLKIGYASISGNRISLWATQDAGFFSRHGIQSELIFFPTSAQGMPALLAGEVPIYLGSADTAALAAARGFELVIFASNEPTQYKLIVQPHIRSVNELRGQRIGVDRIGSSSYYATKRMLEKLGLKAQDMKFLPVPGGGNQRAAAFSSGNLEAVVSTVERFERAKIPYHVLADAVSMGIRVFGNSFITPRVFRDQNRDILTRFIRALVDASYWLKDPKNRESALKIVSQRLRTSDPAVLSLNYRLYIEPLIPLPYTDINDLRTNIEDLAQENAKLRDFDVARMVDNSFIRQVQQDR